MKSRGYVPDQLKFEAVSLEFYNERIRLTLVKLLEFAIFSVTVLYLDTIVEFDMKALKDLKFYSIYINVLGQGMKTMSEFMTAYSLFSLMWMTSGYAFK